MATVGFVGLGNMGGVLAANLVAAGNQVVTHDLAGPARNPDGATFAPDIGAVARHCDVIVLSLPDGGASLSVATQIASAPDRRTTHVVDTSTIGPDSARTVDALLADAGLAYVDAPVSGGVGGARARTLLVMYAGTEAACAAVESVLAGLSDRRRRVGDRPGMAQALKLANNFLAAAALAATSEAVAFGTSAGLDMGTMLDVLNASSGQSAATTDKFPTHVLTGRYGAGFANTLMSKDLRLYLTAARDLPTALGRTTADVWEQFAAEQPGADFTRIYPYVKGTTMTSTPRTITPLSRSIGVEVTGLSGGAFAGEAAARECLTLLDRHGVVVYRDAHIADADLVTFSRMLGEVVVAPDGDQTHPEVSAITLDPAKSKLAAYRKGTFFWHIDGAHDEVPQKATLLHALAVADEGGDTEFANTYAAYEALPEEEKADLGKVRVIHSFTAAQLLSNPDASSRQRAAMDRIPPREHPLVWTRPSGRKSLLLGATAAEIVGRTPEEGRALLDRLQDWCTQSQFVLRHHWRRGDLVVWDNTGMLHRAIPYEATSQRLLHRTTLTGEQRVV